MALALRYRWQLGGTVYEHADFAVREMEAFNKVGTVLATFADAEQAIVAAQELGNGYAACRRVGRGDEVKPRELLTRADLPISLVGMPSSSAFAEAVRRVSDDVSRAVTLLAEGEALEAELHNLRAYLVKLLEIAAPDPELEAACDDLYGAASAFAAASKVPVEARQRLLREAYLRFQTRLTGAVPTEKAQHMGLL